MTTKLEKLLQKEAELKAQIQQAKAREKTLEKKRDTRRKILVGAAVMAQVESGDWPEADLKAMMNSFLTRENERELFGLDEPEDTKGADSANKSGVIARSEKQRSPEKKSAKPKRVVKPLPEAVAAEDNFGL